MSSVPRNRIELVGLCVSWVRVMWRVGGNLNLDEEGEVADAEKGFLPSGSAFCRGFSRDLRRE